MQRIRRGGSFSTSTGVKITAELQSASRDESIRQFDGFLGAVSAAVRPKFLPKIGNQVVQIRLGHCLLVETDEPRLAVHLLLDEFYAHGSEY